MKASSLINQAFSDIGKKANENPISGQEMQDAIDALNLMMYSYDRLGLGHTEVTSSSDDITTPAYSWLWMRKKLAQLLAPEYGRLESYVFLDTQEKDAYAAIRIALGRIGPPQLDGRVPIGSGNPLAHGKTGSTRSLTLGFLLRPTKISSQKTNNGLR